jgi:hypothetical protein
LKWQNTPLGKAACLAGSLWKQWVAARAEGERHRSACGQAWIEACTEKGSDEIVDGIFR